VRPRSVPLLPTSLTTSHVAPAAATAAVSSLSYQFKGFIGFAICRPGRRCFALHEWDAGASIETRRRETLRRAARR
jgi:hypothetical protein